MSGFQIGDNQPMQGMTQGLSITPASGGSVQSSGLSIPNQQAPQVPNQAQQVLDSSNQGAMPFIQAISQVDPQHAQALHSSFIAQKAGMMDGYNSPADMPKEKFQAYQKKTYDLGVLAQQIQAAPEDQRGDLYQQLLPQIKQLNPNAKNVYNADDMAIAAIDAKPIQALAKSDPVFALNIQAPLSKSDVANISPKAADLMKGDSAQVIFASQDGSYKVFQTKDDKGNPQYIVDNNGVAKNLDKTINTVPAVTMDDVAKVRATTQSIQDMQMSDQARYNQARALKDGVTPQQVSILKQIGDLGNQIDAAKKNDPTADVSGLVTQQNALNQIITTQLQTQINQAKAITDLNNDMQKMQFDAELKRQALITGNQMLSQGTREKINQDIITRQNAITEMEKALNTTDPKDLDYILSTWGSYGIVAAKALDDIPLVNAIPVFGGKNAQQMSQTKAALDSHLNLAATNLIQSFGGRMNEQNQKMFKELIAGKLDSFGSRGEEFKANMSATLQSLRDQNEKAKQALANNRYPEEYDSFGQSSAQVKAPNVKEIDPNDPNTHPDRTALPDNELDALMAKAQQSK